MAERPASAGAGAEPSGGAALAGARQEVERLEEQMEEVRRQLQQRESELRAELKGERSKLQRVMVSPAVDLGFKYNSVVHRDLHPPFMPKPQALTYRHCKQAIQAFFR